MRLYYHPMSTCVRRVVMTAQHLGIPLDLVLVDLSKGEQHAPEFLQLNPNHRVPVLEHEGFVLWESYAIMQYLADLTPGQTVYPMDPKARADVNRWLFWCGQYFMPGIGVLNWENSIKTLLGMPTDGAEVVRGESLLTAAASILDAHLRDSDWVCGSAVSLADFALSAPLADQDRAKFPLKDFVHLQRWLAKAKSMDVWSRSERMLF